MAQRFLTPQAQKDWLQKENEKNEEMVWCNKVRLLIYYESLAVLVNEDWCTQFISSAIKRAQQGSPRNIIGTVNGVEIPFCCKYLMEQMDWNFMEKMNWNFDGTLENTDRLCPSPNLNAFFQVDANSKDKYDLDKISKHNRVWGVRIRGLLSGVWFSRKFKFVSKKKLELIMRANAGEVVCWPSIVECAFRKEFWDLKEFWDVANIHDICDTRIGPFLTSYIHAYLTRKKEKNPCPTIDIKAMHPKKEAITTTLKKQRCDNGVGDIQKANIDKGKNQVHELVSKEAICVQKKNNSNPQFNDWMINEELEKLDHWKMNVELQCNNEHKQVVVKKDEEIANLHRQLEDLRRQIDEQEQVSVKKDNDEELQELNDWMINEGLLEHDWKINVEIQCENNHKQVVVKKDEEIANLHRQLADLRRESDERDQVLVKKDKEIADLHRQLADLPRQTRTFSMSTTRELRQAVAKINQLAKPLNSEAMDISDSMTLNQVWEQLQK